MSRHSEAYIRYLQSPYWQKLREEVAELYDYRCALCNTDTGVLDVHHRAYSFIYKNGEIAGEKNNNFDLIYLCRKCHKLFHENCKLAKWNERYQIWESR